MDRRRVHVYNGFSNALKDGGRAYACVNEFASSSAVESLFKDLELG